MIWLSKSSRLKSIFQMIYSREFLKKPKILSKICSKKNGDYVHILIKHLNINGLNAEMTQKKWAERNL